MPPKAKISRDMVVDAALAVIRRDGAENLNVRTVARQLNCSTQPVMYYFATMEELRRAAYERLDRLHTEYLLTAKPGQDPLLEIGLNYIRFAIEEPGWFRFLFQSGYGAGSDLLSVIDSEELLPILSVLQAELGMSMERTKEVFLTIALFAHGYASIIANNDLRYDETQAAAGLERAFRGAMLAAMEEERKNGGET